MVPRRNGIDLTQVAKLFKDTLAEMRDDAPDFEALEPQAIAWLKDARYKIMRRIEAAYYQLQRSRDTPLLQPRWIDPSRSLYISTDAVPILLEPYNPALLKNLTKLISDCGFANFRTEFFVGYITIHIQFPAHARVAVHAAPAAADVLHVDDQFSRMADGEGDRNPSIGAFGASNFARLLDDARGEGSAGNGSAPGAKNKRRRASRTFKDETDNEAPRLQSVTRASSASTLRSNAGAPRRSSRKR
ncbi:hypothetical protein B0H13DRAFT_1859279 [Mycena leptocephala]|nr:hypothetical protein B0H13DRAFT_1859279 [Mycena leptocephala]